MPFRISVSLGILYCPGLLLMQLRDDVPHILYPGHWGLFGGHLEAGESPEAGLRRELEEEISYCPSTLNFFRIYDDAQVRRHVFLGVLNVPLSGLVLCEGWDMALLPPEAIRQGYFYSPKPQEARPLGTMHQRILLDFLDYAASPGQQGTLDFF